MPRQSGHREFAMRKPERSASTFKRSLLSLAVAAACGWSAAPLFAQNAKPAAQEETSGLEEITVTARFREEKLQETPIAITAITGEELQAKGIQSAYEVAYTVPNA